ncbi:adenine deaminase [Carboxylicivirga sp. N1Y90]|uniref:adenine deaminase n=1 Tax=Carboxylicivirga fragile TaxID=3417571 RepID=UPI003D32F602|nr:adenine deaminase [Marinilabiliaceae bacterium N1Y90]
MTISGNIVDVVNRRIFGGIIHLKDGRIQSIITSTDKFQNYILPGLIDSHVHIESSMLVPSRFAHMVVPRGTVAVVSDPHEIANVLGRDGVEYMIKDGARVPLKCFFGVPSCVPATSFESAGGKIDSADIEYLFSRGANFLAEMMNFPGVIYGDSEVKKKLDIAKKYNKRIDGHAPGLSGDDLIKYAQAGISTDHECSTIEEAIQKIKLGMLVQIREGSAARNFDALHELIRSHPDKVMLCTDDSHPDLIKTKGHIDRLIRLGLSKGYDIFELYQTALINPVSHYDLPVGMLRVDDPADFIVVDNLQDFNVKQTYINGIKAAENGTALFDLMPVDTVNNFDCNNISASDLSIIAPYDHPVVRVIECEDGELLTNEFIWHPNIKKGSEVTSDINADILKIVVINRYEKAPVSVGFIKNFGLQQGALASSVAHDSHNIVAVGCDDESLVNVVNGIIGSKGGIAAYNDGLSIQVDLPVAGIMSDQTGDVISEKYTQLNEFVTELGVNMNAPFMTLAFMSLLVIPNLKIGDKGLFDVSTFQFTDLFMPNETI